MMNEFKSMNKHPLNPLKKHAYKRNFIFNVDKIDIESLGKRESSEIIQDLNSSI